MTATTIALVETMPDHLRASHRAAGNWGDYPHNGAVREWVLESAIQIDADDEYDSIVKRDSYPLDDVQIAALRAAATDGTCRGCLHSLGDLCTYDDSIDAYSLTKRGRAFAEALSR